MLGGFHITRMKTLFTLRSVLRRGWIAYIGAKVIAMPANHE
jgi:hypothetical protein